MCSISLIFQIGKLERILEHVDMKNSTKFERVCNYLVACANYFPEPEDKTLYRTAMTIFRYFYF